MKSPLRQIRDAAERAESAAWTCQRAEVVQGGDDHLMVSDWQDVLDMLAHAAKPLANPADPGRWYWSITAANIVAFTVCFTAAALWIPDPQRPAPLTAVIVASTVVAAAVAQVVAVARTARTVRRRTAGIKAWNPTDAIADLRSDLAAIRVSLATRLSEPHLQAAQRIEWARDRLDRLERRVVSNERRGAACPRGRNIRLDLSRSATASGAQEAPEQPVAPIERSPAHEADRPDPVQPEPV